VQRRRPAELADLLGVTRQNLSDHLGDLLGLVLAVDPAACADAGSKGCC
jgi:ArsR family transcriptional regulator, cadmium/lead-responsive transcriptional repressor